MSVTFQILNAPRVDVPCEWCERTRKDLVNKGEAYQVALDGEWIDPAEFPMERLADARCDRWCRGVTSETHPDWPEANFANANAMGVLELLGLPRDYCGEIAHADIPSALQRIMRASNTDRAEQFAFDTHIETGENGATLMIQGQTPERIRGRLSAIQAILVAAHNHGHSVVWG
jgi:hypothetical protein